MKNMPWLVTALLLAGLAPAGAVGESGTVQVCRTPGVVSDTDGKLIRLPVGTVFADTADARDRNDDGEHSRPVRLRLVQDLDIGAAARCGFARAEVYDNPRGFRIGPGEHRAYRLSGQFRGYKPEVVVSVEGDFR